MSPFFFLFFSFKCTRVGCIKQKNLKYESTKQNVASNFGHMVCHFDTFNGGKTYLYTLLRISQATDMLSDRVINLHFFGGGGVQSL